MMSDIVISDLSMQESLPGKGNINFPAREITSLAVKLFPNIGELAKIYASLSGKSLVIKKYHPGRVSDKEENLNP